MPLGTLCYPCHVVHVNGQCLHCATVYQSIIIPSKTRTLPIAVSPEVYLVKLLYTEAYNCQLPLPKHAEKGRQCKNCNRVVDMVVELPESHKLLCAYLQFVPRYFPCSYFSDFSFVSYYSKLMVRKTEQPRGVHSSLCCGF